MKVGDLIEFKCIGAGKTDVPPYAQDGEVRLGLLIRVYVDRNLFSGNFHMVNIFYRGTIVKSLAENCKPIGDK